MKRLVLRMLPLAAAALATFGYHNDAQAQRKLVYATYLTDVYAVTRADKWFMGEVEKRSNGKVKFETYYGGSLLKASDVMPGISGGAADIGMGAPTAYNRKNYPLSQVTLPFTTDRVDTATRAFTELYGANAALRKEFESKNLRLLYAMGFGENTIWSNKPLLKPADIKGLKVRAVLGIGDALNKLGASTLAIPWPDAVEGMQRGVVDAMSGAPFDTGVDSGLHEVAKYASDIGRMGVYAMALTAVSLKTFNSLDADTQKVMLDVAKEVPEQYLKFVDEVFDNAAKKVATRVAAGQLQVSSFSDADTKQMRDTIGSELWKEWYAVAKEAGVDGKELLDQYLALVEKYNKTSTHRPGLTRVTAPKS
ncbi:TRAP transporter substrate-binding protein DctP [Ferrovibrio sp.]|uniref:TRAP transporter substrate-binding protein DctP n=1 Tax=Ferrovibrio sp. TaxID=1917215 RepID=UPI003D2BB7C4